MRVASPELRATQNPSSHRILPLSRSKRGVAYFVRSLRTYARIRSLTTGTFNLIVKDRIADRLSGTNSVQPETHMCASGRPRNPTNIPCPQKPCQSAHPTEFPRDFHIGTGGASGAKAPCRFGARRGPKGPLFHPERTSGGAAHAQRYGLPPGCKCRGIHGFSSTRKRKTEN